LFPRVAREAHGHSELRVSHGKNNFDSEVLDDLVAKPTKNAKTCRPYWGEGLGFS